AWNKLDAAGRLKVELGDLPYDEPKLMDRLIELHDLQDPRKAIRRLARRAILLHTRKSSEAKIPLGATKIGGQPDLPPKTAWPVWRGQTTSKNALTRCNRTIAPSRWAIGSRTATPAPTCWAATRGSSSNSPRRCWRRAWPCSCRSARTTTRGCAGVTAAS